MYWCDETGVVFNGWMLTEVCSQGARSHVQSVNGSWIIFGKKTKTPHSLITLFNNPEPTVLQILYIDLMNVVSGDESDEIS